MSGQAKETERASAPSVERTSGDDARVSRTAHVEREAAAAIAELSTASLLDALEPEAAVNGPPATERAAASVPEPEKATSPEPTPRPSSPSFADRNSHDFGALATSVTDAFKDFTMGDGEWYVELSAPHLVATGTRASDPNGPALQHLRLRPRKRREGTSTIVAGTVNPFDNRAELRDYDHVAIAHEVKHRQPLAITSADWEKLLRKAELVLNAADIQSLRTPPTRELLEQRRSLRRISKGAIAFLIIVLVLATVVAWRVALALATR